MCNITQKNAKTIINLQLLITVKHCVLCFFMGSAAFTVSELPPRTDDGLAVTELSYKVLLYCTK